MSIYYLMMEAKPLPDNEECKELGGAFINCWVNSGDETSAMNKVTEYVSTEGWQIINIEDFFVVTREMYQEESELLDCFDQAVNCGIGAIFYTWPIVFN